MFPIIEKIEVMSQFRYLWFKYVSGVNLDQHCAKCLLGEYSKKITHTMTSGADVTLDEEISEYYYLCGVSSPYRWSNNFHLAFKYSEGNSIEINRKGIYIKVMNAKEIVIKPISPDNIHPKKSDRLFFTCRNWQFANMISEQKNA